MAVVSKKAQPVIQHLEALNPPKEEERILKSPSGLSACTCEKGDNDQYELFKKAVSYGYQPTHTCLNMNTGHQHSNNICNQQTTKSVLIGSNINQKARGKVGF